MDESIKTIEVEIKDGLWYCWKCNTTEVQENALDSFYRLKCNECYRCMKLKMVGEWISTRKNELLGCQICWEAFRFKKKSVVHKCTIVSGNQCIFCAYQLNSYKSWKIHLKVAHNKCESYLPIRNRKKTFECNICKKVFAGLGNLNVHLITHAGKNPFQCKICKKAFKTITELTVHLKFHTGEKPFECQICKSAFATSRDLKEHLAIHTGEMPFECKICKKEYAQSGHLIVHLMTHTVEKLYECKKCGKAFAQTGELREHLRTHTGEKPLKCKFCGKAFTQQHSLSRHLKIHT